MSAETDNKDFITAVMAALGPNLTPDFSKFTYGLWVSSFKNANHSENGYSIPEPVAQDLVSLAFPITGKRVLIKNGEGEAAKVRFFLTESLLGLDGFTYLRDFDLTDRFVSGASPKIIMPDMDYAGKVYRRCEVSGLTKSKSTNKNILTVSGEDWAETDISVNSNDTDELYTYTDSNYLGYKNEVTTRYKFLYDDSRNSIPQDYSVFEIPYKLEEESSLKYRISRASEPLGIYDYADLTTDGKAIIDYTKYKEEVSGVIDGQITYNFEPVADLSFNKQEFESIKDRDSVETREIKDANLEEFQITKSVDKNGRAVFKFLLLSAGDFNDIYKIDLLVERFKARDKPLINGFVMTSYDIGNGLVTLTINPGDAVYPRVNENGDPFGYNNLQDLIDIEQIQESEKYAQDIKIEDDEDKEDESKLTKAIEDNYKATQDAIEGKFGPDDSIEFDSGMQERLEIDEEDLEALTKENNVIQSYKISLPNFPLPKKIITKDFYSNYLNTGENYVVTPLDHYGLVPTFLSCGDKYGVLAYYLIQSEEGADEKKFRSVVNSTCAGLYIKETGFCKGNSAIYDNNQGYSAILNLNYQNGLITQIPENGIISKSNYTNESSYLKAINYFYTKNYVSSFNVSPSLPEEDYITLFSQALRQVNSEIGGAISDSNQDSFYNNGGRSPRIFVEREIYTTSYKNQEAFKLNQSIVNEVYITSDADLSSEEKEKLYCVHAFEPKSQDSFSHNKPNYFYPIQDYSEEVSFKNFISSDITYSSETSIVSFKDEHLQEPKLFRLEYVTGDSFSYNDTENFRIWSANATPPSNIQIPDQDTKFFSYHLYGYNSSSATLSFIKSNVKDGESATSVSFSNLVVLKFIKLGLTDLVFQTEGAGITESSINVNIIDAAGDLLDTSKVKFNIQTYNYNVKINSEANQWVLFNKSPINNNIYGKRDQNPLVPADFSEPRFFEDEVEETKDLLSNLFFFPNGPYTSKNYEGKPVLGTAASLNSLTDGLYENYIYIKEENEEAIKYESNYVLEILNNGNLVKQKPPSSSTVRFKDTRRLKITKIKYNFYTKDLVLIGDSGSPYSVNFNDGWEYDLQYKAKNASYGSSGSSGSSGGGASVDWTIMSKEEGFTNKIISSEYAVISPYYFSEEDLATPNFLSMVAFKTNLPLFLDDNNYEFRILKRQKLSVFSDSANVIKKTNFLPIKVEWNQAQGCAYYNIYQKDRNSNLNFLKSVPSGVNTFSYVVPDVKQQNVDLGVFNFGANGANYYDIVISGIKPAVTKNKITLSQEYGFKIGNSDFSENEVTKLSSPASYAPINVSSPTYSQVLNFNNPENIDYNFTISPDSGGYYFVADGATSVGFDNITVPFESYVLNKNANSCSVNGTAVVTNNIAVINGPSAPSTVALSANPSVTFNLTSPSSEGVLYLKNNITISNDGAVNKKLTIINDSNISINGTFGSETAIVTANKTKAFTFADDETTKSIEDGIEYSNIIVQDEEIYHPDIGFVNLNHTTGSFSANGSYNNLPVFNLHTEPLRLNNLSLEPDSFNYVNGSSPSPTKVEKKYFDDLKLFLKGNESLENSIFMIKDDSEIIISNINLANGSNKEYFFLKDESIVRSVNIKIINGSSTEEISKQNQDFKLTINKKGGAIKYSVLYPSSSPDLEIKNLKEQLVLFKGDKVDNVNLKTLEQGLSDGAFVYFINKNSSQVNFYKDNPREPISTLGPDQIARAILKVVGDSKTVVLQALNETLSHFSFKVDPAIHLANSINILNLNFSATEISLPTAAQLVNKELFLICRNRFLPNKIDKESVVDINSLISTADNPTTLEINEIGDIGNNSISLRVFNNAGVKSIERTSFLQKSSPLTKNIIDIEDGSATADDEKYFYIRNKDIVTFTIKDSYNRKFKYSGKIFLPTSRDSILINSFDSADKNGSFDIENTNSINFDYDPDGYINGRLQIDKPAAPDAIVYSRESEKGSETKNFPNALANGQFLINFAYDTVTVTVDSSQITLKKNRVVCNFGGNSVFPIYNKKEFFIALNNSDRVNTKIGGGTVFYYIINANEVDIDTIVLPDISASVSFVIKNISGRSYQIKTLSGTSVHTLLSSSSNNQKLFTYTGATYTVTTDSTDYDDNPPPEPPQLPNFGTLGDKTYAPTSIKSDNQYTELDNDHPLLDLFKGNRIVNDAKIIFKNKDFDLDFNGSQTKYRIFDIPASATTVTSSNLALIYCYGRKPLEIKDTDKYIVNDFYLFVEHQGVAVDYEQLYIPTDFSKILDQGSHNLKIIDTNHTDLTKFFENQNQISSLPSVIFIPITKYSSKFYLPNLKAKVPSTEPGSFVELGTLLDGKKIIFVNLIKPDASGTNSIYNYYNNTTTDLLDVNSIALFTASETSWAKETSNLPQVKNVFATLKNIQGINSTSTATITSAKEFVYLPNFNRFNVDLNSFDDKSFRDFYVFNSCKYNLYIESEQTLLGSGALTKIIKDQNSGKFTSLSVDQNFASIFSRVRESISLPNKLDDYINIKYPNLQSGTVIKYVNSRGGVVSTFLFQYDIDNKAKEITINNKDFGVLDLFDLINNDEHENLFIYGSSQINSSNNSFDEYELKILNASSLDNEKKFYIYNNTPKDLQIVFDDSTNRITANSKRLIEITNSAVKFLGVHEKGKYYISNKTKNTNYLFKQSLSVFVDGLFDYIDLNGTKEPDNRVLDVLVTNMIRNEKYVPYAYYDKNGSFFGITFDNFSVVDVPFLGSTSLNPNIFKKLLKPNIKIISNGHYLLENNNNDITVEASYPVEIFLINNCADDINVDIISSSTRAVLYRNTVLVLEPGPTSGITSRYLKKAKSRNEFYCIFNPKTVISTQREITLFEKIIRNDDLFPILDDNLIEQKSYVKFLSKNGTSSKIGLFLRDYFNGRDIPTDSSSDIVGYEVGIGHETIYKFLFFDPSESTYTLPGIQSGIKYEVNINESFFDNINIKDSDHSFTKEKEEPYVKYKGKKYFNGKIILGDNVSTYEIKYPNFVTLYKIVEEIDRPFDKADGKGEIGGVDPSITQEETVEADPQEVFNAKIREEYERLATSIISWLPQNQSAFWLNSNYSDDSWAIDSINNGVNPFTITSGNKTITFTNYKIKKTGLKTPLFSYNYSLFSALNPIRKMTYNRDLTIALDGGLKPEQISKIKFFLEQEQFLDNTIFPNKNIRLGGFYIEDFFNNDIKAIPKEINDSELLVNIIISKIKNMPDIKFDDFSKSSVIQIINRKK